MKQTGQILRESREKLGLTIHEISLALKINSRIIKAMEEGNSSQLPPRTFLRGFVQSYGAYLKLDVDQLMETFQAETEPVRVEHVDQASPAPLKSEGVLATDDATLWKRLFFWNGSSSKTASLAVGGLGFVIVGLIVVVSKTINKYQQESKVAAIAIPSIEEKATDEPEAAADSDDEVKSVVKVPEDAKPLTPVPISPLVDLPKAEDLAKSEIEPPVVAEKPQDPPKSEEPAKGLAVKPPEPPSEPVKVAKPVELAKPEHVKPVELAKPVEHAKPVESEPKKVAEAPTEPVREPSGAPQELILEALDKLTVEVEVDGGKPQSFTLDADQIRTIKAKRGLKVRFLNGGAVSLIYNGKDIGVPGELGKPLSLAYPK